MTKSIVFTRAFKNRTIMSISEAEVRYKTRIIALIKHLSLESCEFASKQLLSKQQIKQIEMESKKPNDL